MFIKSAATAFPIQHERNPPGVRRARTIKKKIPSSPSTFFLEAVMKGISKKEKEICILLFFSSFSFPLPLSWSFVEWFWQFVRKPYRKPMLPMIQLFHLTFFILCLSVSLFRNRKCHHGRWKGEKGTGEGKGESKVKGKEKKKKRWNFFVCPLTYHVTPLRPSPEIE